MKYTKNKLAQIKE